MNIHIPRRLVAAALAVGLMSGLVACGDDDDSDTEEAPIITNEFGIETFEPGDDSFDLPETVEPTP